MKIGYVRVSTVEQHVDRQIAKITEWGAEKFYIDKLSGKDMNRPELQKMLEFVREGDVVCALELSRLGRSVKDLIKITGQLEEKKVELVVLNDNIDTSTPTGRMVFHFLAALAQFERETIRERQMEGIIQAKLKGVYKGRKKRVLPDGFERYYRLWLSREISISQISREVHICRPVLRRLMREFAEKYSKDAND